jgi:prolyl-tRNA editing enzyme YbaK/EbsC (Cys-tRNA(Pro) deacylase)
MSLNLLDPSVLSALEALGIADQVTVVPCDESLADTAAFCAHYGFPESRSANCITVVGKSEPPAYAACLLLATTRLDVNKVVRKKLGAKRASFASADEAAAITGMRIGGVTPFGLPATLPLWIDARVVGEPWVIVGGGSRTAKLQLDPQLLLRIPGAEVVEDLART